MAEQSESNSAHFRFQQAIKPKAMILAAGKGERMMPLTADCPKPLLTVADKPLLEYHIDKLKAAGMTDLVINQSYLGEKLEAYFSDGKSFGVNIQWSREESPLETAGGIKKALPFLGDQPFLIINGDVWCDFKISDFVTAELIQQFEEQEILAHLMLVPNPEHNPKGDFGLDLSFDKAQLMQSQRVKNESDTMYTYAGIALLSPKLFGPQLFGPKLFENKGQKIIGLAPLLRKAIESNQVTGQLFEGDWQDIGTPERLESLRLQVKNES